MLELCNTQSFLTKKLQRAQGPELSAAATSGQNGQPQQCHSMTVHIGGKHHR